MDITIVPLAAEKMKSKIADESQLGFGKYFTDRMLMVEWKAGQGWHDARIEPYAPFVLDPSCSVFHYAQEIFEGLKALRGADGKVGIFRPQANAERINASRKTSPASLGTASNAFSSIKCVASA